jgi:hypothetical protein
MNKGRPPTCTLCFKPVPLEWCWMGNPDPPCPLGMPPRWEVDPGMRLL